MATTVADWMWFDAAREGRPETTEKARAKQRTTREQHLYCTACRNRITSGAERIAVQGGHEHTFVNPHGLLFHIGCFRHAEGCTQAGDETAEFTWFRGCQWRYALCDACGEHLGWLYRGTDQGAFYGLILSRLVTGEDQPKPR